MKNLKFTFILLISMLAGNFIYAQSIEDGKKCCTMKSSSVQKRVSANRKSRAGK